jgi:hypothetical protein
MPDWQLWIGLLALLVSAATLYYQRRQTKIMEAQVSPSLPRPARRRGETVKLVWWKTPALPVLALLVILAWLPKIMDAWEDTKVIHMKDLGYGGIRTLQSGQTVLTIAADITPIAQSYGGDYRIVGAAIKTDHSIDLFDEELLKSAAHDLHSGSETFLIPVTPEFVTRMKKGVPLTLYYLLILPKSLSVTQFSTLRQAYSLKVLVSYIGAGPP